LRTTMGSMKSCFGTYYFPSVGLGRPTFARR
jgi:hypothetical protein